MATSPATTSAPQPPGAVSSSSSQQTPSTQPAGAPQLPSNQSTPNPSGSSANAPAPKRRSAALSIKQKLLKPALTSHYEVHIPSLPNKVSEWMNNREIPFVADLQDLLTLSCSEASLPGSSLMTSDINDNYTGVTERYAYRRQYDDTADFTFYVDAPKEIGDKGYRVLWFFEQWMSCIVDEQYNSDQKGTSVHDTNYFYRVRFPDEYRKDMYITKFERDHYLSLPGKTGTKKYLQYKFVGAYPTSITSMPVSYEQSQVLKVTVSFSYLRYIVERKIGASQPDATYGSFGSSGTPSTSGTSTGLPGYDKEFAPGYGKNPLVDPQVPVYAPAAPPALSLPPTQDRS